MHPAYKRRPEPLLSGPDTFFRKNGAPVKDSTKPCVCTADGSGILAPERKRSLRGDKRTVKRLPWSTDEP
jgi:hypothetical protein